MRRAITTILLVLCAAILGHAGLAAADPAMPGPATPTGTLPTGFPEDLKKFIGGTPEFKSAPWFGGACRDHGGDMGAYIDAAFAVEDRLIYWSMTPDQQKALLNVGTGLQPGHVLDPGAQVDAGVEPPHAMLPKVFPAEDPAFGLPTHTCADDLKRWSTPQWNTWGFTWAGSPDKQSLTEMRKTAGFGDVPDAAWSAPCGGDTPGNYCAHAFFVDCSRADALSGDQQRCLAWNNAVAHLFAGTANWISKNKSFTDRVTDFVHNTATYAAGSAFVSGFSWFITTAVPDTIKFVADPGSVIDDWANSAKASAVDLSAKVLRGLATVGTPDLSQAWFLRWYALSTGLGIAVMGLMTLLALWRAASRGETTKTIAADLLGYMPAGIVMMIFAPLMARMLTAVAGALSDSVVRISGPDMGQMINNLEQFTGKLSASAMPGGVIVGLFLFLLLIAGCLAVFFGLLMHACALPALAVASGIGFGMWVHPRWRAKALRPVLLFVGVVLSKPLLFLLLAVETSVINASLTGQDAGQGDLGTLGRLCLVAVAFVTVGLAPWSLLKYAPLLPSRSDANGFGGHSGSLMAGAVGGIGSSQLLRHSMAARGGEHTESAGGGRSAPAAGTDRRADPAWRTAERTDGRSPTEARFAATMGSRNGSGGAGSAASKTETGRRLATKVAGGLSSKAAIAASAAAAVPVAAAGAAAALNKARSVAEAAPGEAEE